MAYPQNSLRRPRPSSISQSAGEGHRLGTEPRVGFIDKLMCHFCWPWLLRTTAGYERRYPTALEVRVSHKWCYALFFDVETTEGLLRTPNCEPTLLIETEEVGGRGRGGSFSLFLYISQFVGEKKNFIVSSLFGQKREKCKEAGKLQN